MRSFGIVWRLFAVGILCLAATAQARAETLISDTFDAGASPTRLNDAGDSMDADWWVVGRKMVSAGTTYAAAIGTDPTGINSGNCLTVDKTTTSTEKYGSRVWVNLPGYDAADETADNVVLGRIGEYLQLKFDIRVTSCDKDMGGGFRFGFYSKDSLFSTTADPIADFTSTTDNAYLKEADGYLVSMGTGDGVGTNKCSVTRETENDSMIMSATANDQTNYYSWNLDGAVYELDTLKHTIQFRLTRTDTGMRTTVWVDDMNNPVVNQIDTSAGFLTSFDGFIIGNHPSGSSGSAGAKVFALDNVEVISVPEPSAIILLIGMMGMLLARRGKP